MLLQFFSYWPHILVTKCLYVGPIISWTTHAHDISTIRLDVGNYPNCHFPASNCTVKIAPLKRFPKKKSLGNHTSTVGPPGGWSDELVGPTCSSARFINYWCFNCNLCFLWLELIAEWNYWGSEENCVHVEWGWSAIWGDCGYDHAIAIWCVFLFQNKLLVFYFACLVFC